MGEFQRPDTWREQTMVEDKSQFGNPRAWQKALQEEDAAREGHSSQSSGARPMKAIEDQRSGSSNRSLRPIRAPKTTRTAIPSGSEGHSSQAHSDVNTFQIPETTVREAARETLDEDKSFPEFVAVNRDCWKTSTDKDIWFAKLEPDRSEPDIRRRHALVDLEVPAVH